MDDVLEIVPVYNPQAIVDWYFHESNMKDKTHIRAADLTLKAKKHLSALGWGLWYGKKGMKRELRYTSPTGKCYYSLRTACKGCMDEEEGGGGWPLGITSSPNNSLPGESSVSSNSMQPTTPIQSCSELLSRKRKRKDKSDDTKDGDGYIQNPIKPRRGKVMKKLIKLRVDNKKPNQRIKTRSKRSSKRARQKVLPSTSPNCNPRTILAWLIDNNVVLARSKVHYHGGEGPLAEGRITRNGINCNCCSNVFTIRGFELHAGSKENKPAANIILEDGRSLLDCQIELMGTDKTRSTKGNQMCGLKIDWNQQQNDDICSLCHYEGELILCDGCPSSFHKGCLGLEDVPDGDWFCPSCCCGFCGQSQSREDSFLSCDQCQHKYHVGCLRNRGLVDLETHNLIKRNLFCSSNCEQVFFGLQNLLGKLVPVGVDNLTWTLLKSIESDNYDIEAFTENQSKLHVALDVMHECFEPVKEAYTGRDLVEDVIFSRGSELNRLNYQGFYIVVLERNDQLISVATVRIYRDIAEIPLVATRFQHRRHGMCRILMNELEKQLLELGVERLILPAAAIVLNTWIDCFGFSRMTSTERQKYLQYNFLDFQGTVMCHKLLMKNPSAKSSLTEETLLRY